MLNRYEVRLRILNMLIPAASRHGISEPEQIIKSATALENYVVESAPLDVVTPDTPNRPTLTRPRKEKPTVATPDFLTPPPVDKSNQAPG